MISLEKASFTVGGKKKEMFDNLIKIKKFIIRYLPHIIIYVGILSFGFYGTAIRQKAAYNEYNHMPGVVTSFTVSHSGSYLCDIRLENGMCGSVNNGYTMVTVGSPWVNDIYGYSWWGGISGFAGFIVPNKIRCLTESMIMLIMFVCPLAIIAVFFICQGLMAWSKAHKEGEFCVKKIT